MKGCEEHFCISQSHGQAQEEKEGHVRNKHVDNEIRQLVIRYMIWAYHLVLSNLKYICEIGFELINA